MKVAQTYKKIGKSIMLVGGILILGLCLNISETVYAQLEYDSGVDGLQPIQVPAFFNAEQIQNFSIFSYISLALSLVFVAIGIYWIVLTIRAAVKVIQSSGNEEQMQQAYKSLGGVFWSITFLFGFFLVLVLVSSFFGFGNFLQWPKYLSRCNDGSFYFTKTLESPESSREQIDNACF